MAARLSLVGLVAACRQSGPPEPAASDAIAIPIVRLSDLEQVTFSRLVPTLSFSIPGSDSFPLSPNVQAVFAPDSTLWVTAGTRILVFDVGGRLVRVVGRTGDGPGEFRLIQHLGLGADGLPFATDFGSGRMATFAPSGELVRTIPRVGRDAGVGIVPLTVLADRRILAGHWQQRPNRGATVAAPLGTGSRDPAPLVELDSTGTPIATAGWWSGLERARVAMDGSGSDLVVPFARTALMAGREGMVAVAATDSVDVTLFEGTRPTLRLMASVQRRPPTATERREWESALKEQAPDVAADYLLAIRGLRGDAELPAIGAIRVDRSGNLLIGGYVTKTGLRRTWRVFSRAGSPVGQFELPSYVDPLVPGPSELLDVRDDRIAVLRVTGDEVAVEVLVLSRP